jgi:hypothetical protein
LGSIFLVEFQDLDLRAPGTGATAAFGVVNEVKESTAGIFLNE